jgi:TonB family protein
MTVIRNSERRLVLLALGLTMVVASGVSAGQENKTREQFVSDSERERDPAVTAFPKYPYVARRDRLEGEATVCFTVNARGQVIRPSIRSSSHKIFEKPAMKAIRESTFDPLKPGETKSNLKTCRLFRFRLDPILASNNET